MRSSHSGAQGAARTWPASPRRNAFAVGELEANGKIPGQQPEPNGDPVGMEAIADEVIKIMPVEALLDRLLRPPALPVGLCQPLRTRRAKAGDIDPRTALVGGRAGTEREEPEAIVPGTNTQADGAPVLEPAPLLGRERRQTAFDRGGPSKPQDEWDLGRDQCWDAARAGKATIGDDACELPAQQLAESTSQERNEPLIPHLTTGQGKGDDLSGLSVHRQQQPVAPEA